MIFGCDDGDTMSDFDALEYGSCCEAGGGVVDKVPEGEVNSHESI